MKKSNIALLSLLVGSLSFNASADGAMDGAEFFQETLTLKIPTVKIGDDTVYNGVLKLNDQGSFDIVGFSRAAPEPVGKGVDCTADLITDAKFEQITDDMTLEQVNAIIGCEGTFLAKSVAGDAYTWKDGALLPRVNITFPNETSLKKTFTR